MMPAKIFLLTNPISGLAGFISQQGSLSTKLGFWLLKVMNACGTAKTSVLSSNLLSFLPICLSQFSVDLHVYLSVSLIA